MTSTTTAPTSPRASVAGRLAATHCGHLLHIPRRGWFVWNGRRWTPDHGQAVRAVLDTARAILTDPDTDPDPDLRAAAHRSVTPTGLAGVLRAAATMPPLAGTPADLTGPPPEPAWAPGDHWTLAHHGALRGTTTEGDPHA